MSLFWQQRPLVPYQPAVRDLYYALGRKRCSDYMPDSEQPNHVMGEGVKVTKITW